MQMPELKAEATKPLQDQLRQLLDVAGDEYDVAILQSIEAGFRFCRKVIAPCAGAQTSLLIEVKPFCTWYDVPIDSMAQIISVHSQPQPQQGQGHSLLALQLDEFLPLGPKARQGAGQWAGQGAGQWAGRRPLYYTYFSGRLGALPLYAGSDMQLEVSYIGQDAETFFAQAFDLIKARALYDLYQNFLYNAALAQASLRNYNEQLALFQTQRSRSCATGKLNPTSF